MLALFVVVAVLLLVPVARTSGQSIVASWTYPYTGGDYPILSGSDNLCGDCFGADIYQGGESTSNGTLWLFQQSSLNIQGENGYTGFVLRQHGYGFWSPNWPFEGTTGTYSLFSQWTFNVYSQVLEIGCTDSETASAEIYGSIAAYDQSTFENVASSVTELTQSAGNTTHDKCVNYTCYPNQNYEPLCDAPPQTNVLLAQFSQGAISDLEIPFVTSVYLIHGETYQFRSAFWIDTYVTYTIPGQLTNSGWWMSAEVASQNANILDRPSTATLNDITIETT